MSKIPVNSRQFALIDDCDVDLAWGYEWRLNVQGYVVRGKDAGYLILHKVIGSRLFPLYKEDIDHEDRNKLNCQRFNLREATVSQNIANSKLFITNTTGYKGCSFVKRVSRYRAYIVLDYKQIRLGYFPILEEAAMAYDLAAIQYFGKFAVLNFPK
jgi:hypothetical protein